MNTIQENWDSFNALVIPKNADAIQRQEMRKAFYAGAGVMLNIFWAIGDKSISEEAGLDILEGCSEEINMFVKQIQNGSA